MAAKDITSKLDARRSIAGWGPPPRWQAVHAQRLWSVLAYRMANDGDTANLLRLISARTVGHLQDTYGTHDPDDPHPQLTDAQLDQLKQIAEALRVDATWLCGGDQACPHHGISEMLRFAAWVNLDRQAAVAEGRSDRPSAIDIVWLWIEAVEDAWVRMLTNPRDTRLISKLKEAVEDATPMPTIYRDQLLVSLIYPSIRPLPLRNLLAPYALVRLGKDLLPKEIEAPELSEITGALAALDSLGPKTQAVDGSAEWRRLFGPLPHAPPETPKTIDEDILTLLRAMEKMQRGEVDHALKDEVLQDDFQALRADLAHAEAETVAVLDAIHGERAFEKAFEALRAARQEPANTKDNLFRRAIYRVFVTRFPKQSRISLLDAVQQYRSLWSEMQAPNQDTPPWDAQILDLFNRCDGRLVQAKALREALGKITGIDPELMMKALITQGRTLDRPCPDQSHRYVLILDADDRAGWSDRPKYDTPRAKAVGVMAQTAAPTPTTTEEVPVNTKPATPPSPAPPAAPEPSPLAAKPTTPAVDQVRSGSLPTKAAKAKRPKQPAPVAKTTKSTRSNDRSPAAKPSPKKAAASKPAKPTKPKTKAKPKSGNRARRSR